MDEKPRGKPLLVILSVVFLDLVGIGILIPVVPILLAGPRSPFYLLPVGYTIQTGYILLGWLVAIYPLCQFLAAPILGQLSDRYGRRKLLGISVTGTCISYIIFALGIVTRNIPLLFLARGFDGVTGGNIPVAQAVIADITPPEQRAKNFGLWCSIWLRLYYWSLYRGKAFRSLYCQLVHRRYTVLVCSDAERHERFPDTPSASRDARSRTKAPQNSVESLIAGHRSRVHL